MTCWFCSGNMLPFHRKYVEFDGRLESERVSGPAKECTVHIIEHSALYVLLTEVGPFK